LTLAELAASGTCLVCGAAAEQRILPDTVVGASLDELEDFVPDLPLCGGCAGDQQAARKLGRGGMLGGLLLVPVLAVALVLVLAVPWLEVARVCGAPAFFVYLALLIRIGRLRRRALPVAVLDGSGEQVRLQLLNRGDSEQGPYRSSAERHVVGHASGRQVRQIWDGRGWALSAALLLTGFFSAVSAEVIFSRLELANESGVSYTASLNGGPVVKMRPDQTLKLRVRFGTQTLEVRVGNQPQSVVRKLHLRFGTNHAILAGVTPHHHTSTKDGGRRYLCQGNNHCPYAFCIKCAKAISERKGTRPEDLAYPDFESICEVGWRTDAGNIFCQALP